ncbi:F-box only protein 39-like [Onthophagus taurus]|uniref:F-box only protein 39-like n=1 Tax=Onthophagus taurus TaxID=166361 RepID=UPI000C205C97|nr:F-box only protein 39-like [Onthophagus taurus]
MASQLIETKSLVQLKTWDLLPTDVLALIFSFLPRRDRLSCSMVCMLWKEAINSPQLWKHMVIIIDKDLLSDPSTVLLTRDYHQFIKSLELTWSRPYIPLRWLPTKLSEIVKRTTRFFNILTENFVQLRSLKMHWWNDLTRFKKIVYHMSLFLKIQACLTDLCFFNAMLNKCDFVKFIASCMNCKMTVTNLDIRNSFYNVDDELDSVQLIDCIEHLNGLRQLKVDFPVFRREIMHLLSSGRNTSLNMVEVHVFASDMIPIRNSDWRDVSLKLSNLNVALHFIGMLDLDSVVSLLQRSIPLHTFTVTTARAWQNYTPNSCKELFRVLTSNYKNSLEIIDCRLYENVDTIDDILFHLLINCTKLKKFSYRGGINTIELLMHVCQIWSDWNGHVSIEINIRRMNMRTHSVLLGILEEMTSKENVSIKINIARFRNELYFYY